MNSVGGGIVIVIIINHRIVLVDIDIEVNTEHFFSSKSFLREIVLEILDEFFFDFVCVLAEEEAAAIFEVINKRVAGVELCIDGFVILIRIIREIIKVVVD